MGLRSTCSSATTSLDSSAMDLADRGLSQPCSSRFHPKLASAPARLQPCDSSMLDLTVPFSHATSLVRRVFTEALLLLRLAVRLWTYLGVGWKWSMQLVRLVLYATLLLPGFLQMIAFYIFSPRVQRSVVYGPKPRQRLDLYSPPQPHPHAAHPVVIYVTGGAWTIGYKAWGALLARRLSQQGVLVACLDYRNFPQGDALDMLEDVNTGISWVLSRIHRFGGDPDSVTLVGQSAGGHLAGLALIKQSTQAAQGFPALGATPAWVTGFACGAFVGVSGAFDLEALAEHLHRRGLYKSLFERIMSLSTDNGDNSSGNRSNGHKRDRSNGNSDFDCDGDSVYAIANGDCDGGVYDGCDGQVDYNCSGGNVGTSHDASGCKGGARPAYHALSPLEAARRLCPEAAALLPYALLIHGTADKTVPSEGSSRLCEALTAAGASRCHCVLVPGKTHTAFLLEDPMRGGRDMLSDTVLGAVTGGEVSESHVYGTLCPGFLCDLAGRVCPF